MSRIYAPNEAHVIAWGAVDFINGAAAMDAGDDTSYFSGEGYGIDTNKHALTIWDQLTRAQLETVCDYLGVSYTAGSTKQEMVRAVETLASTHLLGALTITSAAGTEIGDTLITVTNPGTQMFVYKTGTAALAPLYKDDVSDWTPIVSGTNITPPVGATHITVASINAGGLVLALGSAAITVRTV